MTSLAHLAGFAVALTAAAVPAFSAPDTALAARPGYVDLGEFVPSGTGGQFVEINVHGGLLALASRFVAKQEPDVAELLKGLHSVRVNVVQIDDANREELTQRAESIQQSLTSRGWDKVVTVRETKEHVNIYVKAGNGEAIEGITLTVLDKNGEAVFINIVGDIRPEQLALVGDRLGIDPLKHVAPPASES